MRRQLHALVINSTKAIYQLYRLRPIGAGSPRYGYSGFIGEDEGVRRVGKQRMQVVYLCMSNKPKLNSIDFYIDKFVATVLSVEGFGDAVSDKFGKAFLDIIFGSITDFFLYRDLLCTDIVPAIDRTLNRLALEVKTTKYPQIIPNTLAQLKYTKQDHLRHAYVHTFHKYENFAKQIKTLVEDDKDSFEYSFLTKGLSNYAQKKFGVKLVDDWHKFLFIHNIQFISNATKHKSGRPISNFKKPKRFESMDESAPIELTLKDYKTDFLDLMEQIKLLIQLVGKIRSCQMQEDIIWDWIDSGIEHLDREESKLKLLKQEKEIFDLLITAVYPEYIQSINRTWMSFEALRNKLGSQEISAEVYSRGKAELMLLIN